jgi:hypothetical protein
MAKPSPFSCPHRNPLLLTPPPLGSTIDDSNDFLNLPPPGLPSIDPPPTEVRQPHVESAAAAKKPSVTSPPPPENVWSKRKAETAREAPPDVGAPPVRSPAPSAVAPSDLERRGARVEGALPHEFGARDGRGGTRGPQRDSYGDRRGAHGVADADFRRPARERPRGQNETYLKESEVPVMYSRDAQQQPSAKPPPASSLSPRGVKIWRSDGPHDSKVRSVISEGGSDAAQPERAQGGGAAGPREIKNSRSGGREGGLPAVRCGQT